MKPFKQARMRLSLNLLEEILIPRPCADKVRSNAPEDLRVIGVIQNPDQIGSSFEVVMESETFRPILPGQDIPLIEPFIYYKEVPRD